MNGGVVEALSVEQKYDYLRQYSHQPVGFLTTQPGFMEFHIPGVGYASFARHFGANLVLGDPICSPDQLPMFLEKMIKAVPMPNLYSGFKTLCGTFGPTTRLFNQQFWP